ncbi:MAG: hypothetical protein KGL63_10995, partial [Betaproteobacteria bacterium]|nr:hypothetical protein [Betaproteobacteria bacterium]
PVSVREMGASMCAEYKKYLEPLIGLYIWGVRTVAGSILNAELGDPHLFGGEIGHPQIGYAEIRQREPGVIQSVAPHVRIGPTHLTTCLEFTAQARPFEGKMLVSARMACQERFCSGARSRHYASDSANRALHSFRPDRPGPQTP